MRFVVLLASAVVVTSTFASEIQNRPSQEEIDRVTELDPSIKPDPVGNALIGGAVTGSIKGAAAGAASAVRGAAIGVTADEIKESLAKDELPTIPNSRPDPNPPVRLPEKVSLPVHDPVVEKIESSTRGGDSLDRGGMRDRGGEYKGQNIDTIERWSRSG